MIRCIECKQASTIEEWNYNTRKYYGNEITPIEHVCGENVEVFFYCPKCNLENYAFDLILEVN
jgi:hypothetical protein